MISHWTAPQNEAQPGIGAPSAQGHQRPCGGPQELGLTPARLLTGQPRAPSRSTPALLSAAPMGRGGPPVSPRRVGGPLSLPVRESGGPLQPRQERPHLPALSPGTFSAPWAALARSREQYCLAWEAKYLMELGNALETILSGLANMVAQEALKYTVLSGEPPLSPASGMPTTPKPHWSCAFASLRSPRNQALCQSLGDPVCDMVIMVFIGRK